MYSIAPVLFRHVSPRRETFNFLQILKVVHVTANIWPINSHCPPHNYNFLLFLEGLERVSSNIILPQRSGMRLSRLVQPPWT